MAGLVLGPMLRYADGTCATVWVETDASCEVSVLGVREPTFQVAGHHYALVLVQGLEPGCAVPYEVHLDGERVWPLGEAPSLIRTPSPGRRLRLVFGSCRVTAPHTPPYTLDSAEDERGLGLDALRVLAQAMRGQPPEEWPDTLLFLGDQVYADEVSPAALERVRARRDTAAPPGEQAADFEEYTWLYQEAWSDPTIRWLLSTVPSAMIFDDHDVHDDWNTSQAWRERIRREPWWTDRVTGGLMAYWVYQHLGNLPPAALQADQTYARVREVADGAALLRSLAVAADAEPDGGPGVQWSYRRDLGAVRLLVVDSRCGRVLGPGRRRMVDEAEWAWIEEQARCEGSVDHLLFATSLPFLLPPALHHLEGWNEAVAGGAWGRWWARWGERLRQGADLEHWAAFRRSFDALSELIHRVATAEDAPASVVVLSGDVHFAYLAEAGWPGGQRLGSRVFQAVCSPLRNPVGHPVQALDRLARTRVARALARTLARSAGVRDPAMTWEVTHGPWFESQVATLDLSGRSAHLRVDKTLGHDRPGLEEVFSASLATETARPVERAGVADA